MQFAIVVLVCCLLGSALAYPQPDDERWSLHGGHNHDKNGHDIHVSGSAPVWTSNNGRHEVDVNGGYKQHRGGPWGNGPAGWQAGGVYRYRF